MIRIECLEIENLKNIGAGVIRMPDPEGEQSGSVLTIYGQNGSGKSGVIDALTILRTLMSGKVLSPYFVDLIDQNADTLNLKVVLDLDGESCSYALCMGRRKELPVLVSEKLIGGGLEIREEEGADSRSHRSAIFREQEDEPETVARLRRFALEDFYILKTQKLEGVTLFLPNHRLTLPTNRPFDLRVRQVEAVRDELSRISTVFQEFVPGVRLEIEEKNHRYELISVRGETRIPFRFESVGLKKLAVCIPYLIRTFGSDDCVLACDELDYGIHEFLFGQILEAFEKFGSGQLIFTSHNLRALELLPPEDIVFTTRDADERFLKLTLPEDTPEMRALYYREVLLGEDELYENTSAFRIGQALFEAAFSGNDVAEAETESEDTP